MTWSALQYSQFEDERTRPIRDLVAAIPSIDVHTAIDLGCGPGNSTEVLATRFSQAAIHGIDSSGDMIIAARKRLPNIAFDVADIANWQASQPMDLILANASLQWLSDHHELYPRLVAQLANGGCLAVQTPDNLAEPAHRIARELSTQEPWSDRLSQVSHPARHDVTWYYALLKPLCSRVEVWRTTYFPPLANHDAIVEWFKGSALLPYLAQLDAEAQQTFLAAYRRNIADAYPQLPDGTVLLPFPRLFLIAIR